MPTVIPCFVHLLNLSVVCEPEEQLVMQNLFKSREYTQNGMPTIISTFKLQNDYCKIPDKKVEIIGYETIPFVFEVGVVYIDVTEGPPACNEPPPPVNAGPNNQQ